MSRFAGAPALADHRVCLLLCQVHSSEGLLADTACVQPTEASFHDQQSFTGMLDVSVKSCGCWRSTLACSCGMLWRMLCLIHWPALAFSVLPVSEAKSPVITSQPFGPYNMVTCAPACHKQGQRSCHLVPGALHIHQQYQLPHQRGQQGGGCSISGGLGSRVRPGSFQQQWQCRQQLHWRIWAGQCGGHLAQHPGGLLL